MSWGTCYAGSNNIHFDFPPIMSDGRNYAAWIPGSEINNEIKSYYNISSNWKYRQFLQQNGSELMDRNRNLACEKNCCLPCSETQEGFESTMLPEKYAFVTDGSIAKMVLKDPNGLGTGRQYYTSVQDQDCTNMPNASQGSQQNNCVSGLDRFHYIGLHDRADLSTQRVSVPGGGMVSEAGDPNAF